MSVVYRHFRADSPDWKRCGPPTEHSFTVCHDRDNRVMGVAACSPKDQFSKKEGRTQAEYRAMIARQNRDQLGLGPKVMVVSAPAFRPLNSRRYEQIILWAQREAGRDSLVIVRDDNG